MNVCKKLGNGEFRLEPRLRPGERAPWYPADEAEAGDEDDDEDYVPPTGPDDQAAQQQPQYDMRELSRQLGLISAAQDRHGEQLMMVGSQLGQVRYEQDYFRPFMQHWASREAQEMQRDLPTYAPPEMFIPRQSYGGFYYPPRQPQGGDAGAGGSGAQQSQEPSQFGHYQGGSPSIFPDPSDMQE